MSTAEKAYRQALKANPRSARAAFNLGDVYLNKKDAQNALKFYEQAAKQEKSKLVRAMAYHNMGYIHHVAKEYDRAINYYKDALRNNPKDDDTRGERVGEPYCETGAKWFSTSATRRNQAARRCPNQRRAKPTMRLEQR